MIFTLSQLRHLFLLFSEHSFVFLSFCLCPWSYHGWCGMWSFLLAQARHNDCSWGVQLSPWWQGPSFVHDVARILGVDSRSFPNIDSSLSGLGCRPTLPLPVVIPWQAHFIILATFCVDYYGTHEKLLDLLCVTWALRRTRSVTLSHQINVMHLFLFPCSLSHVGWGCYPERSSLSRVPE